MCIDFVRESHEQTVAFHTSKFMRAARHIYERLGFIRTKEIALIYRKSYWNGRKVICPLSTRYFLGLPNRGKRRGEASGILDALSEGSPLYDEHVVGVGGKGDRENGFAVFTAHVFAFSLFSRFAIVDGCLARLIFHLPCHPGRYAAVCRVVGVDKELPAALHCHAGQGR